MVKILTVVGARPQFIKAAVVSRALRNVSGINEILLHTGQHYDHLMSEVFFDELQIPKPKYNLNIRSGRHGEMTASMLKMLENILFDEAPDAVLVYGDTNSTLSAALAASKLHIPLLHVEAGLRSFNKKMPEEINRVLTDHVSELLFCPTSAAVMNLEHEGINNNVFAVGDVMLDAVYYARQYLQSHLICDEEKFSFIKENFAILTLHRQESTSSESVLHEMLEFASKFAVKNNLQIIFPSHPRTKTLLQKTAYQYKNITCIDPVGYFDMQMLLMHSKYVLTDSGGLQKEAYFHRVPCITLREETEWVETIKSGWNRLWKQSRWNLPRQEIMEYGDGQAGAMIAEVIVSFFKETKSCADTVAIC